MSDLRTYQMLAYMTHRPDRYRELLGLPAPKPNNTGRWPARRPLRPLWTLLGRGMSRAGAWMLRQAEPEAELTATGPQAQPTT